MAKIKNHASEYQYAGKKTREQECFVVCGPVVADEKNAAASFGPVLFKQREFICPPPVSRGVRGCMYMHINNTVKGTFILRIGGVHGSMLFFGIPERFLRNR